MKVSEIFESLQGEGKYIGTPVTFIRLSGCTRACDFCDTKYHNLGRNMKVNSLVKKIERSKSDIVVWTGGEPMLQQDEIYEVIMELSDSRKHQIETNGDILPKRPELFNYICFSPKEKISLQNVVAFTRSIKPDNYDIKIVTDLQRNVDLIEGATILMPLSTYEPQKDKQIQKDVWKYCCGHKIKYTPRIHVDVWGQRKHI